MKATTIRVLFFIVLVATRPAAAQTSAAFTDDLFNGDVLHEIRLTVNPPDWNELKASYQTNTYYPAHFSWRGMTAMDVGIRSRGAGSRSSTKPGLRVDFDFYVQGQRFLGLKSLVLRNNTQDPSHLHERLSMLFFSRMGVPASREAHTRLFINGEYAGLYTLVESVDKAFLDRTMSESGGYLYHYDYESGDAPYYFEYLGSDAQLYSPHPFQPETHETDPDPSPIVAMIRAINETSGSDFLSMMPAYLDLRLFMTHVAIENFLGEIDGILGDWGTNNFYFYRFENTTRSMFIPWDKSEAFNGGVEHGIWHNVTDVDASVRNRLMNRVVDVLDLRDVYLDVLLACADVANIPDDTAPLNASGVRPGWLEQEILKQYALIREAVLEDSFKPFSNDEFEASIVRLLEFARGRSDFVRQDVARSRR